MTRICRARYLLAAYFALLGCANEVSRSVARLQHPDPAVRRQAAELLGARKDPKTVDPLLAALRDSDSSVRAGVAAALGEIGDVRAAHPLMDALRDPSLEVSRQSAEALAKIGPPALPGLLAMAKQETNDHARASLSLAIGRMRTPGVVSQVLPLLAEKDVPLRITACKALGMLGSPEAVGPLFNLRSDAPYDVLKAAEEALVNLGPAAVDPLAEKLGDKNSWVREDAASILGRIGSPALPRLAALVQDEDPKRAMAASNALALMAWGEQRLPGAVAVLDRAVESHDLRAIAGGYYYFVRADPSPETRALLVQALNKYGSKEMAEEMLDSGHQDLVRAARTWARAHGYDIIQLPGSPQ